MNGKMSASEIQAHVGRLKDFWQVRNKKFIDWYKLRMMVDNYKMPDYESMVANDPKSIFNLAQYLLCALPPRHKIPVTTEDKPTQEKIGKAERALISLWRDQDEKMVARMRRPWRWELADFLLITGWYAVLAAVLDDGNGKPLFVAEIWNPMEVYQDVDEDGLFAVAHEYPATGATALRKIERAGWKNPFNKQMKDSDKVVITDYWRRDSSGVYNAVLMNAREAKPLTLEAFDELPVITGVSAGEAAWGGYGIESGDTTWQARYGESILAPNEKMFDAQNKLLSLAMQIAKENAQPNILDKNVGARALIKREDIGTGKVIHLEQGQDVVPMRKPEFEQELNVLMGAVGNWIQRSAFPYSLYGNVPPSLDLSGYAIGMLMTAAQNVVGSYHNAMTFLISKIDRIWLEQYSKSTLGDIEIAGRTKGGELGSLFHEGFGRSDVPDCTFVDVAIPLGTPSDFLERVAAARQAMPVGNILDQLTLLDELNLAQDPLLVMDRLGDDLFRNSPVMQQLGMIKAMKEHEKLLRERGQKEEAAILATAAAGLLDSLGRPAPGQQEPVKPGIPPEAGLEGARGISPSRRRQIAKTPPPQVVAEENVTRSIGQTMRR